MSAATDPVDHLDQLDAVDGVSSDACQRYLRIHVPIYTRRRLLRVVEAAVDIGYIPHAIEADDHGHGVTIVVRPESTVDDDASYIAL